MHSIRPAGAYLHRNADTPPRAPSAQPRQRRLPRRSRRGRRGRAASVRGANRIPPPCSITRQPVSRPEPCQCRIDSTRPSSTPHSGSPFPPPADKAKKPEPDPPPRRFPAPCRCPDCIRPMRCRDMQLSENNPPCAFYPMPLHPKGCCLKPSNHLRSYRPRWRAAISGRTADSAPAAFRLHPNNYRCDPRSDKSSFLTPSVC